MKPYPVHERFYKDFNRVNQIECRCGGCGGVRHISGTLCSACVVIKYCSIARDLDVLGIKRTAKKWGISHQRVYQVVHKVNWVPL